MSVHVGNIHDLGRPAYSALQRIHDQLGDPDPMVTLGDITKRLKRLIDSWPEADPPPNNVTNALRMLECQAQDRGGAYQALSLVLYG